MQPDERGNQVDIPSGLRLLLQHLGPDLLHIERIATTGEFAFTTTDREQLVEALLRPLSDPTADEVLSVHAALLLGAGQEIAPLEYVLPKMVPLLESDDKHTRYWAALALEFAAPAPGNEDMVKAPSHPRESLARIADKFPEVRQIAEHILRDHLNLDTGAQDGSPPMPT